MLASEVIYPFWDSICSYIYLVLFMILVIIIMSCKIILLQKPGGIIALLDEAWYAVACWLYDHMESSVGSHFGTMSLMPFWINSCSMFPKSTHETFAQKLYQTFKNNKRFIKPKLSRTDFTISHYAGEVRLFLLHDLLMSANKCLTS